MARNWACNPHRAVVHTPAGGPWPCLRMRGSKSSRNRNVSRRCRQPVKGGSLHRGRSSTRLWPGRVWCEDLEAQSGNGEHGEVGEEVGEECEA